MKKYYVLGIMLFTAIHANAFVLFDINDDGKIQTGIWQDLPVSVHLDSNGDLPNISGTGEDDIMAEILAKWSSIDSSVFDVEVVGKLDCEELLYEDPYETDPCNLELFLNNCVIYDNDGEVVEYLGGDKDSILGFASPAADASNNMCGAMIALNGHLIDESSLDSTMTHEFGHFVGLDHAPIYSDDYTKLPTLFPFLVDGGDMENLHVDDKMAVSSMYPSSTFTTSYGAITGTVEDQFGTPLTGVHVVAVDTTTLTPIASAMTSFPGTFGCDESVTGYGKYLIPVPPGSYYVKIESMPTGTGNGNGLIVCEGGASGTGQGDFTNSTHTFFDTGFPDEYYPNQIDMTDGDIVTVDEAEIVDGIDFEAGFGYTYSARVGVFNPNAQDLTVTLTTPDDVDIDIPIDSSRGTAVYEVDLTDYVSDLPPSSTNVWTLAVFNPFLGSAPAYLMVFQINANGTVYKDSIQKVECEACSSGICVTGGEIISNFSTLTRTLNGSSAITSTTNSHTSALKAHVYCGGESSGDDSSDDDSDSAVPTPAPTATPTPVPVESPILDDDGGGWCYFQPRSNIGMSFGVFLCVVMIGVVALRRKKT